MLVTLATFVGLSYGSWATRPVFGKCEKVLGDETFATKDAAKEACAETAGCGGLQRNRVVPNMCKYSSYHDNDDCKVYKMCTGSDSAYSRNEYFLSYNGDRSVEERAVATVERDARGIQQYCSGCNDWWSTCCGVGGTCGCSRGFCPGNNSCYRRSVEREVAVVEERDARGIQQYCSGCNDWWSTCCGVGGTCGCSRGFCPGNNSCYRRSVERGVEDRLSEMLDELEADLAVVEHRDARGPQQYCAACTDWWRTCCGVGGQCGCTRGSCPGTSCY